MTLGSLFDGISGLPLSASWAGIETKWVSEIDPFCLKISNKHFPKALQYGDIKQIGKGRIWEPGPVDIISGGFPCQPFSAAGEKRGQSDNRYLWPEMLRVIAEVRPLWVVGENVAGIINMALEQVLSDLESEGYKVEVFIIPACAVGAWHKRDRVWIVANSIGSRFSCGEILGGSTKEAFMGVNGYGRERAPHEIGRSGPTQSGICRGANGVPDRVDRIKALGNAIVPQVAYEIFKAIVNVQNQILHHPKEPFTSKGISGKDK